MTKAVLPVIGQVATVVFNDFGAVAVPARVDTGAKTSALWVSQLREHDGGLEFVLFDKASPYYSGKVVRVEKYKRHVVASSVGAVEERYGIACVVQVEGRKIKASFTLANRENQVYPVLLGRSILRGKFLVDVRVGESQIEAEQRRTQTLRQTIQGEEL